MFLPTQFLRHFPITFPPQIYPLVSQLFPIPTATHRRFPVYSGASMATERQIQANRANAAKSTGPITAEGKRASSQNAARPDLVSSTVVLKGESVRRFNDLASALMLQFKPRNSAETFLVQTMTVARWRLLRMWGIQTAGFELEMARANQNSDPSAGSGAVLAAVTFRNLADSSRALALQLRYEAAYDRQYNRALALLLKLREMPGPSVSLPHTDIDPPLQIATETWDDDSPNEPNFDADPGKNPTCNEQVPDTTPNAPPLEANPISPRSAGTLACRVSTHVDAQGCIHPVVTSPVTCPVMPHRTDLDRRAWPRNVPIGRRGASSYPRHDHPPSRKHPRFDTSPANRLT